MYHPYAYVVDLQYWILILLITSLLQYFSKVIVYISFRNIELLCDPTRTPYSQLIFLIRKKQFNDKHKPGLWTCSWFAKMLLKYSGTFYTIVDIIYRSLD